MIATLLVIIGVLARLIPHAPNFAPVAAATLFGAAYLPKRIALMLPLATMMISDIFIGFDNWSSRITVYSNLFWTVRTRSIILCKKSLRFPLPL